MGSCTSKKKSNEKTVQRSIKCGCISIKKSNKDTVQRLPNQPELENDPLNESSYTIKEFDATIKSPFKKEEVDITMRVSQVAESYNKSNIPPQNQVIRVNENYVKGMQAKKPKKEISPEILIGGPKNTYHIQPPILHNPGNENYNRPPILPGKVNYSQPPIAPVPNHSIVPAVKRYDLLGQVTKVTENYVSKIFVNNKDICEVVVYAGGIVFLPKKTIKSEPNKYYCEYYDKRYCLDLMTVFEQTATFKLADFDKQGLEFSSTSKKSDKMKVTIGSELQELTKVPGKKNTFECSQNIDDSYTGTTVNIDDRPCFIIQRIIGYRTLEIVDFSDIDKMIRHALPPPSLPYEGLATDLYDQSHTKISQVFQYKNIFFSYNPASSGLQKEYLALSDCKFVRLNPSVQTNFMVFSCEEIYSVGLEKYEKNEIEKNGKLYSNNKDLFAQQSEKNPEVFSIKANATITTDFIGFPIYGSNDQPFGIVISIESTTSFRICKISNLFIFFNELNPSYAYYPIQDSSSGVFSYKSSSSSSSSSSSGSSSDFIEVFKPRQPEALGKYDDDGIKGEISFDLNFHNIEQEPEEISYALVGSTLLKFSNKHYNPEKIQLTLPYSEDASYTTSQSGLIVVCGKSAYLVKDDKVNSLLPLSVNHQYHGALVHNQQLYVISGKGTAAVEYLNLSNINGPWNSLEPLPEIREKPAACSSGNSIFVFGGACMESITGTVYKFSTKWETLNWTVPRLMGMGAIYANNGLVLFGGKGNQAFSDFYYVYSLSGQCLKTLEFPTPGLFHNKSIGISGNTFTVIISESQSLEYEDSFKLVSTTLSS